MRCDTYDVCGRNAGWEAEYEFIFGRTAKHNYCSTCDLWVRMNLTKMGFGRIITRKRIPKESNIG